MLFVSNVSGPYSTPFTLQYSRNYGRENTIRIVSFRGIRLMIHPLSLLSLVVAGFVVFVFCFAFHNKWLNWCRTQLLLGNTFKAIYLGCDFVHFNIA